MGEDGLILHSQNDDKHTHMHSWDLRIKLKLSTLGTLESELVRIEIRIR